MELASFTAYSFSAGSTNTASAARCSSTSWSATSARPAASCPPVMRSTITNSSVGVGYSISTLSMNRSICASGSG